MTHTILYTLIYVIPYVVINHLLLLDMNSLQVFLLSLHVLHQHDFHYDRQPDDEGHEARPYCGQQARDDRYYPIVVADELHRFSPILLEIKPRVHHPQTLIPIVRQLNLYLQEHQLIRL